MSTQLNTWLPEHPLVLAGLILVSLLIFAGILHWLYVREEGDATAKERAEQLLQASLTPAQYQQLQKHGYFELPSRLDPERFYRIPHARRRVQVFQTDALGETLLYRKMAELCVIACEQIPDADLVLTHKWMIEADERSYLSLANWINQVNESWHIRTAV